MLTGNLLDPLPPAARDEVLDTLLTRGAVRIERIVSTGQSSPAGFWYDQDETEFVVLLAGAARLRFEDGELAMTPGSYVTIAPHRRHRVEWTQADPPTVWLTVFFP